jgi:hypothetical protein
MPAKKRKTVPRAAASRKGSPRPAAGDSEPRERPRPSLLALTSQGLGALRERARMPAGRSAPDGPEVKDDRLSAALERLQADYDRVLERRR